MAWKMEKSRADFVWYFNKISHYVAKYFLMNIFSALIKFHFVLFQILTKYFALHEPIAKLSIILLNDVMPSANILNIILLWVVKLIIILLSIVMLLIILLSTVMLIVFMLGFALLSTILLSVILLNVIVL
jgi:hypothetical protein